MFQNLFGRDILDHICDEEKINRVGYNKAASEFTDKKRITTRAFHTLSVPFWKDSIERLVGSILEIGPGHGWLRRNFTWNIQSYQGIDISEKMLKYNQEPTGLITGTIQEIDLHDEEFDAIVGSLIDPCLSPSNLVHIFRLLKYGGIFIGTVPALDWSSTLRGSRGFNKHETVFHTSSGPANVSSYCFSKKGIYKILEIAGFNNIEVFPITTLGISHEHLPPDISSVTLKCGEDTPILYGWRCMK